MALTYYRNKSTGRTVIIILKEEKQVLVQYTASGTTSWFRNFDFERIFKKVQ